MSDVIEITKKSELVFKIDDQIYSVRKPGAGEMRDAMRSLKEATEEKDGLKAIDTSMGLLIGVGFPEEVVKTWDDEQMQQVFDSLVTAKKKSLPNGT